jgi:hypothetical protein
LCHARERIGESADFSTDRSIALSPAYPIDSRRTIANDIGESRATTRARKRQEKKAALTSPELR